LPHPARHVNPGYRKKKPDGNAGESERRVALGFPQEIPLKAGCQPALQLFGNPRHGAANHNHFSQDCVILCHFRLLNNILFLP
jgi:hypothetical protein